MSILIQRSFSGGEIAPALYSRVDTQKYVWGLRTLRNMLVRKHGGADNRPGTDFISEIKDSSKKGRLIPFIFNSSQTYVLEFGNQYLRVYKNGVQLTDSTVSISGVSNANPCVLTCTAHGFSNGDEVALSGILGNLGKFLNDRNFKIANVTTNSFSLLLMDGVTALDSTSLGSFTSGGTASRVYTLSTPYVTADLPTLKFIQSADVVTITHPNYPPQELKRTGDVAWSFASISFQPLISNPQSLSGPSSGGFGAVSHYYAVTAVSATGEESFPGVTGPTYSITGITNANPARVTASGIGAVNAGSNWQLTGVTGMTEVNNRVFQVTNTASGAFDLLSEDSTNYGTYVSGGTIQAASLFAINTNEPSPSAPWTITWAAVSGAVSYNVYKQVNGVMSLLGVAQGTVFNDIGTSPNSAFNPPAYKNPFPAVNSYPSCVAYYQQRLSFANTIKNTETVYTSKSGKFKNFSTSFPSASDDAVTFQMAGAQVNPVKHLVDIGKLIVFTASAEYVVGGDVSGILRPGSVNPNRQSAYGSSDLAPIVIGNDALFLQARGSIIRDLGYANETQGYRGNDLTIFSTHLFEGFTITDWAYQQIPNSIVWAVRSDGTLLGLTYIKEQQIWAWHRHDTLGFVENVVTVPEGAEDVLYLIIKRMINGRTVRYLERMNSRFIQKIEDTSFVDASLSYDGRNTSTTSMTLSGGSQWLSTETLTLTSSTGSFSSSDVGNQIFFNILDSNGNVTDQTRFTITGFTSATVVTGSTHKTVPISFQNTATLNWAKAISSLAGLWHLEGQKVSILADGFVIASPNNAAYTLPQTVTNGQLTLPKPYSVIQVGLPYFSDIETLDLDSVNGTSISHKMIVQRVWAQVEKTRGIFAGPKPPSDDSINARENLYELKARQYEMLGTPNALITDKISIQIQAQWNSNGRVFLRQIDPLPFSLLSVAPEGILPMQPGAGG